MTRKLAAFILAAVLAAAGYFTTIQAEDCDTDACLGCTVDCLDSQ